jgi:predicted membrane protein
MAWHLLRGLTTQTVARCLQAVALNHSAVRVHVTHGGAHSLAESYVGGVPVVVIPQFADQPHNAALAQYRGAGVSVSPKGLTPHGLRQAIRDVLYAPRYAAAAARLGAILRGAGGAGRAATVVEDALHGRLDGAIPLEYSMPWLERYHLDAYCIYLVIAGAAYWLIKRMEAKYFPNPTPTQAAPKRPKAQKAD